MSVKIEKGEKMKVYQNDTEESVRFLQYTLEAETSEDKKKLDPMILQKKIRENLHWLGIFFFLFGILCTFYKCLFGQSFDIIRALLSTNDIYDYRVAIYAATVIMMCEIVAGSKAKKSTSYLLGAVAAAFFAISFLVFPIISTQIWPFVFLIIGFGIMVLEHLMNKNVQEFVKEFMPMLKTETGEGTR